MLKRLFNGLLASVVFVGLAIAAGSQFELSDPTNGYRAVVNSDGTIATRPAGAAADNADAVASVSTGLQNAVTFPYLYNGTTWDRARGDTTAGLWVQIKAALPAGTALLGKVGIDQTTPGTTNAVSVSQINGVTALTGNGATGTGALRVSIASDSTGIVALPAAGTSIVGTKAAGTAAATSALTGAVYNSTTPTLTDGQQIARQADTTGAARVSTEGGKTTYSAIGTMAVAASATDIFTITGSASKTVRVTRLQISGTATSASAQTFFVLRRSTANSGGSSGAQVAVPHDSTNAAATATVLTYTANPTAGTIVGSIRTQTVTLPTSAGAIPAVPAIFDFTTRNSQGIVLRGTSQVLAVNLNGVTITGGNMTVDVEWTEE